MVTDDLAFTALTERELDALADEFVILASIRDHPRLAGWGRRQAWLVVAEIAARCGADPGPTPEVVALGDLPTSEQLALRDLFAHLAELDEIEGIDRPMARWLRATHRRIIEAINARRREIEQPDSPLRRWIRERRRERPHGTPGDVGDLPPWSNISGGDDAAGLAP